MKSFVVLITAALLSNAANAQGPTLIAVLDFLKANVEGKKFETTQKGNVQKDATTGKPYVAEFTRSASYSNLWAGEKTLTFDYNVDVDWKHFDVIDENGPKLSDTPKDGPKHKSVLSFELKEYPGLDKLVGLARFTKNSKDGADQEIAAKAYSVSVQLNKDGDLELSAVQVFPEVWSNNPSGAESLRYFDFKEVWHRDASGKLERTQVHFDFEADPKTLLRGKEADKPMEVKDTSSN